MIYWLKTKTDIDADGYAYDTNCFPLDTNGADLDLDTPLRKYTVNKIIGNGATVSGGDTYGDRKMSFKMMFKPDGVGTSGALTTGRLAFLTKFIVSNDEIYLIRDYKSSLQYIRVYPVMGSERYKKLVASDNFDIQLICSQPFFKDVTPVAETFTKISRYHTEVITNSGITTPFLFKCTFDDNDTEIKVAAYENMGVHITQAFTANDVLKFDTANFRIWINDVERFNVTVVGTPFNLLSGVNRVKIESISNLSDCSITYTGRHL
jgi:hypothetical protein